MNEIISDNSSHLVNDIKIIKKRYFQIINDVEVEICEDDCGYLFVRHNVYWWLAHRKKNPDPHNNRVLDSLSQMVNNRLETTRWAGYSFKYQRILMSEDGSEFNAVLLPLEMFEDFIRWSANNYGGDSPPDYLSVKLGKWLKDNSLKDLLKVDNKEGNPSDNNMGCSFFQPLIKLLESIQK